jgi:integrase
LKGSRLRVSAICNLDLDQLDFRRLERVKEKGLQERNVVIFKEAYDRIKTYIEFERISDVEIWGEAPALFLSIPQTKKRNPDATGRMNSRTIRRIIDKIDSKALVQCII